jgi:hypothetical protein
MSSLTGDQFATRLHFGMKSRKLKKRHAFSRAGKSTTVQLTASKMKWDPTSSRKDLDFIYCIPFRLAGHPDEIREELLKIGISDQNIEETINGSLSFENYNSNDFGVYTDYSRAGSGIRLGNHDSNGKFFVGPAPAKMVYDAEMAAAQKYLLRKMRKKEVIPIPVLQRSSALESVDTTLPLFLDTQNGYDTGNKIQPPQIEIDGQTLEVNDDTLFPLPTTAYTLPITLNMYSNVITLVNEEIQYEKKEDITFEIVTTKYRIDNISYQFTFDLSDCQYNVEYDSSKVLSNQNQSTVNHTHVLNMTYRIERRSKSENAGVEETNFWNNLSSQSYNQLIMTFSNSINNV